MSKMKQNITLKQLNELSGTARAVLNDWSSKMGFYYKPEEYPPLLSIGQMIEFLNDTENQILLDQNPPFGWQLWLNSKKRFITRRNEPMEVLWEAVKEVLGNENTKKA